MRNLPNIKSLLEAFSASDPDAVAFSTGGKLTLKNITLTLESALDALAGPGATAKVAGAMKGIQRLSCLALALEAIAKDQPMIEATPATATKLETNQTEPKKPAKALSLTEQCRVANGGKGTADTARIAALEADAASLPDGLTRDCVIAQLSALKN